MEVRDEAPVSSCRAQILKPALPAERPLVTAQALAEQLHEPVMVVDVVGCPLVRNMLVHEDPLRRRKRRVGPQEAEPLRHSKVMAIDDQDALSKGAEVQDRGTHFGPYAGQLAKP